MDPEKVINTIKYLIDKDGTKLQKLINKLTFEEIGEMLNRLETAYVDKSKDVFIDMMLKHVDVCTECVKSYVKDLNSKIDSKNKLWRYRSLGYYSHPSKIHIARITELESLRNAVENLKKSKSISSKGYLFLVETKALDEEDYGFYNCIYGLALETDAQLAKRLSSEIKKQQKKAAKLEKLKAEFNETKIEIERINKIEKDLALET